MLFRSHLVFREWSQEWQNFWITAKIVSRDTQNVQKLKHSKTMKAFFHHFAPKCGQNFRNSSKAVSNIDPEHCCVPIRVPEHSVACAPIVGGCGVDCGMGVLPLQPPMAPHAVGLAFATILANWCQKTQNVFPTLPRRPSPP